MDVSYPIMDTRLLVAASSGSPRTRSVYSAFVELVRYGSSERVDVTVVSPAVVSARLAVPGSVKCLTYVSTDGGLLLSMW